MELIKLSKVNAAVLVRLQAGDFDSVTLREASKLSEAVGKQLSQLSAILYTPDRPADVPATQAVLGAALDALQAHHFDYCRKSAAQNAAWEAEQATA